MELYSRRIIGRHVAEPMRAELVCAALRMAIVHRRPPAGLIFHSDRGVQYAAERFRTPLEAHGMLRSMSRKGDCYDNAPMESRMGTLKTELDEPMPTHAAEARSAGFEFVEVFYNRQRLHSTLAYLTPEAFECEAPCAGPTVNEPWGSSEAMSYRRVPFGPVLPPCRSEDGPLRAHSLVARG
jgi:transposase InsO family protein